MWSIRAISAKASLVVAACLVVCVGLSTSETASAGSGNFREKRKACFPDLQSCPTRGCEEEGSPHAQVNQIKRTRPSPGTPVSLTFDDFAELQEKAEALVGEGEDIAVDKRSLLQNISLASNKTVSEGDLVELRAFVVKDSPRPKPAGPESVNCRLSKAANNDIHIPVVEEADDEEFGAIVVEMIPQSRPAKWNSKNLKRAAREERPVIIRGQLFYDNNHKTNGDAEHDNGEPKRFSLWEVHPITEFFVCARASLKCGNTPTTANGWKALKDF
jgi:hypothetical protein